MKRMYLIWGGLLGFDGYLTSAGMTGLESQLAKYGPVKSYMQSGIMNCVNDIYKECAKEDICVLGGFSGGGVQAIRAAVFLAQKRTPQDINLFINIDSSPRYNLNKPDTLPRKNIKQILNIYNPNAGMLGGGYIGAPGIAHDDHPMRIGHLSFQFNQQVRDIVESKVKGL